MGAQHSGSPLADWSHMFYATNVNTNITTFTCMLWPAHARALLLRVATAKVPSTTSL